MSYKRKHTDEAPSSGPSSTKKPRANFAPDHPHNRQNRAHGKGTRPSRNAEQNATTSINALKSRIRDLRRLLDHADNDPDYKFPANVRRDRERELEASEHELAEKRAAAREYEVRKKMIGKYHQVRFFDRQKATRILKRLKRALKDTEDEAKKTDLQRQIHATEVDLSYAMCYPLMKPYSSLYPKTSNPSSEEATAEAAGERGSDGPKGDPEMWRSIEMAMEQGQGALNMLRNWRPRDAGGEARPEKRVEKKRKEGSKKEVASKNKESSKAKKEESANDDEDEDSDGGFFE